MIDYPLDPRRVLGEEVPQALAALLSDAVAMLRNPPQNGGVEKGVHEARKRLKEARSLLRLVRTTLLDGDGEPVRGDANRRIRDAARLLGGARDAAAMIETLDDLKLDKKAITPLRKSLLAQRDSLHTDMSAGATLDAARHLDSLRGDIDRWQIKGNGWPALRDGVWRLYKLGCDDYSKARKCDGDAEQWHEFRKRAKDLRYALELLRSAEPTVLDGLRTRAKELTDVIGLDHDLAELAKRAEDPAAHSLPEFAGETATLVAEACATKRHGLQQQASHLAAIVYAEKPSAFVKRLGVYWQSAAT